MGLKNKANVLQPDKRCLLLVRALAVEQGGFSPEGVDLSVEKLWGSRAWETEDHQQGYFFPLVHITQINATLWDVSVLPFSFLPLHFTVLRQHLTSFNVKTQCVHCNHRCTIFQCTSLSLQPLSERQNPRGGVRLRSAHLRCDLLLHRLLLFP